MTTIFVPRACLAAARRPYSTGWHHAVLLPTSTTRSASDVLVNPGNQILAEGADLPGDRGGHAQPRVGVDIGGADKALHQLVGDVVILGQELAGDIERDRIRPVLGDCAGEDAGHQIERLVPARADATDFGV